MEQERHAALRLGLGLFFGTTPEFWQKLQSYCAMKIARRAPLPEMAEKIASQHVT